MICFKTHECVFRGFICVCVSVSLWMCVCVRVRALQVRSCGGNVGLDQKEMERVLMEALFMARSELEAVPGLNLASGLTVFSEGEEKTMALLEQYSQLLLQSVEKRLEHKI